MTGTAMGPLAQGAAGVALALGFALLAARRFRGAVTVCAAQALAVAVAALGQGETMIALVELAQAGVLVWYGRVVQEAAAGAHRGAAHQDAPYGAGAARHDDLPSHGGAHAPPSQRRQLPGGRGDTPMAQRAILVAAGAILAALAATVPGTGLAFTVVLLGLLVLATEPRPNHQALGVIAAQSGIVLAAIVAGISGWSRGLAVLPLLPALAFAGLWLGASRARTARLSAPAAADWIDTALCSLALMLASSLPWQLGLHGPAWRLDARTAHVILLLCALAAAASWGQYGVRPAGARIWGSRLAILMGTVLAVLSDAPVPAWLGMAVAAAGTIAAALPARAEAWRRLRLGCTGLALASFGAVALSAMPPPPHVPVATVAAAALGYVTLALLAPELTVAAIALILRLPAPPFLLLTLGLAALLVATLGLTTPEGRGRRLLPLVGLAQGGAAVFAFGLGSTSGAFAGLLQLTFLALTQCALLLARPDGLDRLVALAGLAGVPPFGLFSSLALLLAATAASAPLLLLPLGVGLAAVAWAVLAQLPAERRFCVSPAWLPLALLLLCGFAMPAPWVDWFRLAAR